MPTTKYLSCVRRCSLLPHDRFCKISENLIAYQTQMVKFSIINADENNTIVRQQLLQQLQARVHHAQPLVVAGQILSLFADNLAQPLFDLRVIDIIVVDPALVAGVVGRIDVNALDAPLIPGQQRFRASRLSPRMIMFSLPLSSLCCPFSSKLYLRSNTRNGTS